ncbi:hypothetical protein [Actinomadura sp. 3N508]|uniref:hypothetical protein n=1 Tax=Actinomadura sp. 3N508 TaxID=3375153 RepID=UPI0037927B66
MWQDGFPLATASSPPGLAVEPWHDGSSSSGRVVELAPLEKPMTARMDRLGVFAASATARTLKDLPNSPETTERGTRTVAVRFTTALPTSPTSHRSRWSPEPACRAHVAECFVHASGRSAVSCKTTSRAVPPWAVIWTV